MSKGALRVLPRFIKRLNGWQRVGIVLSILWALGAGISTHNEELQAAESYAKMGYANCIYPKLQADDSNLSSCEQERKKNVKNWLAMGHSTENDLFDALAPIPFGWLAGLILLYTIRAQIAGFRAVIPWKTLDKGRKSFVVFCALASFVAVLFSITGLLNLYTDSLIPVSLSPFLDVIPTGDNFVTVNGTWTRTDLINDSIAYPLQTSHIECNRQEKKCTEAKAHVSGNLLSVDLSTYDIQSWTPNSIVFGYDDMCASEVYTIDLNTKTVSGAGHLTNEDTNKWCKTMQLSGMGNSKENWTLLLSNGFNTYWELRKKARPMPLRLIQTLFGN